MSIFFYGFLAPSPLIHFQKQGFLSGFLGFRGFKAGVLSYPVKKLGASFEGS
ncbi:MAG: hypothetical protein LBU88_07555 [Treponema sp.]|jgi:hypothetical protein|nr:hypothetical protein [Treponema sp.]